MRRIFSQNEMRWESGDKSVAFTSRALISNDLNCKLETSLGEQGWCSGESAHFPPICHRLDSRTRRHMWVEFVVGSLLCSERFFSGYSGFPLSSKTSISKFQFDLDYYQVLFHEPLARVIAQALPVLDIEFAFAFTF